MIDLLKPLGIWRLPPRATTPCHLTIGLTSCVWSPRRTQVGLSIGQFQEAYDDKGSPWVTIGHLQKAHKMENHEIVDSDYSLHWLFGKLSFPHLGMTIARHYWDVALLLGCLTLKVGWFLCSTADLYLWGFGNLAYRESIGTNLSKIPH